MKFLKLVVISIPALFALACGDTTTVTTPPKPSPAPSQAAIATPTPDPMAATKEYYADNCASCHQDNGEGGIVKIEGKKLNVPPLTKGHALNHNDEEFVKQISSGGDGMPAFKDKLKPEEINNLVTFVRTQFQGGGKSTVSDARPDTLTAAPAETKKKPMDMPKH